MCTVCASAQGLVAKGFPHHLHFLAFFSSVLYIVNFVFGSLLFKVFIIEKKIRFQNIKVIYLFGYTFFFPPTRKNLIKNTSSLFAYISLDRCPQLLKIVSGHKIQHFCNAMHSWVLKLTPMSWLLGQTYAVHQLHVILKTSGKWSPCQDFWFW